MAALVRSALQARTVSYSGNPRQPSLVILVSALAVVVFLNWARF